MRWRNLAVGVVLVAALGLPAVAQEDEQPADEVTVAEPEAETAEEPAGETEAAPEVGEPPREEPPPFVLPEPTATPATPGPGAVLLADNFDDPTRAQLPLSATSPDASQGYIDGEYEMINGRTGGGVIRASVPGTYGDSSIAVDVRVFGGPQGRSARAYCRVGRNAGYVFRVRPDTQRFALLRRQPGPSGGDQTATLVDQPTLTLRGGGAVNHLELSCVGSTIRGLINGVIVVEVQDPTYPTGGHAIGVGGTGATARFDNLVVTQR